MKKQYHKLGEQITLSDEIKLVVAVRHDEIGCKDCYYYRTVDCSDRLCNFNERFDLENIIFKAHE